MTINEVEDIAEICNQCGIFLFGMLPNGIFATPWVEGEFHTNNALRVNFNKAYKRLKHRPLTTVVGYHATNPDQGVNRLYCCSIVEKDGAYTAGQLTALKQFIEDDPVRPRMFPLMDTFGSLFDLIFPSHPSDQPGGIFITGYIDEDTHKLIADVFQGTTWDIFIEKKIDFPSIAKLNLLSKDHLGRIKVEVSDTSKEKTEA